MESKTTTRPATGDGYVKVRIPGAGEVRLDLRKHIDNSLKSTSNEIAQRYKLSQRSGRRKP